MKPEKKFIKDWQRLLFAFGMPALALIACIFIIKGGRLSCHFYELTGLYCPGCGSGRAMQHLFNRDIYSAFRSNILLFVLGPPALAMLMYEYIRLVFPSLKLRPIILPDWVAPVCLILVVLFWILRNIPQFAFLAP